MPFKQVSSNTSLCDSFLYNPNVVPVLYLLMLPLALTLNGVAAWVFLYLKSNSIFVVYLKNLVAGNLIMTLIMTVTAARNLWDTSVLLLMLSCHMYAIFYSSMYTCITFLGIISLHRFFKIVTPHRKLMRKNLFCGKLLPVSVWGILFGTTALPNILLSNKPAASVTEIHSCMNMKGRAGLEFHKASVIYLSTLFWITSLIIVVCYISITNKIIQSFRSSGSNNNQQNQKTKLRVFLIVIVFFGSFGPYHLVRMPYTFLQVSYSKGSCSYSMSKFATELSLWFATTNTCMNPLLYIFLCREFKEKLTSMMKNVSLSFRANTRGEEEATP